MKKQKRAKKTVFGLTGSFGTGKSTVGFLFGSLGAEVINVDQLAHDCYNRENPVYRKTVRLFGKSILARNGDIDRKSLAKIVFADPRQLKRLEAIVHPEVIRMMKCEVRKSKKPIILVDAPLLIEAGLKDAVDKIIVVKASQREQIKRLKEKAGLNKQDVLMRIKAQLPLSKKVRMADFVIDNNGSLEETSRQVERIWRSLAPLLGV